MAFAGSSKARVSTGSLREGRYVSARTLKLPGRNLFHSSNTLGELGTVRLKFMKYDPALHGLTQTPNQHDGLLKYEVEARRMRDSRQYAKTSISAAVNQLTLTSQQQVDFPYKLNIRPELGFIFATSPNPHYEDIVGVIENNLYYEGDDQMWQPTLHAAPYYAIDGWEHVQKPDGLYYQERVGTSWQTTMLGGFAIIVAVVGTAAIGGALLGGAAGVAGGGTVAAGAGVEVAAAGAGAAAVGAGAAILPTVVAPVATVVGEGILGTGISLSTVATGVGLVSTGYKMLAAPSPSIGPSSSPPVVVGYNPRGAPIYSNVGTGVDASSFVPSGDSAVPWLGTGELPPEGLFGVPWLYVILGGGGLVLLYMMSTQRRASYTPVQQTVGLSANLRRRRRR